MPDLGVADLWYMAGSGPGPWELPIREPLPAWARFIADLAADMPLLTRSDDGATTAVLAVPTRGYAAAIAAAAIAVRRDELDPAAPDNLEEHLEDLRALPLGTRVQYGDPSGKLFDGRWAGFEMGRDGVERVCVELRKNERRSVLTSHADRIVPTGEAQADGQLRVRNVETSSLLRGLRGQTAAIPFMTTARCEVVIVGTSTVLRDEMCEQLMFVSGDPADPGQGYLQDLARVGQFPGASRYYRSVLIPLSSEVSEEQRRLTPSVVVYDGGRAFLHHGHLWPHSHRLVILDRSVTSSEDAALELNQDWGGRRGDTALGEDLTVPDGIEFVAFRQ